MNQKDYRNSVPYQLYVDAEKEAKCNPFIDVAEVSDVWWAARFAARQASGALLDEARKVGVTDEQWEALRKVAAHVAAD